LNPPTQPLVDLAVGGRLTAGLLVLSGVAVLLAWRTNAAQSADASRRNEPAMLMASALLLCTILETPFRAYSAIEAVDPRIWMAPFDRFGRTFLLWAIALLLAPARSMRERMAAVGLLVAASLGWAFWMRRWTALWLAAPHRFAIADPTGIAPLWDLALVAGAVALAVQLRRRSPATPNWTYAALAIIGLTSLLDAAAPLRSTAAVWSRLGLLLAASTTLIAAATSALTVPRAHGGPDGARRRRAFRDPGKHSELAAQRARALAAGIERSLRRLGKITSARLHRFHDRRRTLTDWPDGRRLPLYGRRGDPALLPAALERIPLGVAVLDRQWRIVASNRAAAELLGSKPLRPGARAADCLDRLNGRALETALEQLETQRGPVSLRLERPYRRIDIEPLTAPGVHGDKLRGSRTADPSGSPGSPVSRGGEEDAQDTRRPSVGRTVASGASPTSPAPLAGAVLITDPIGGALQGELVPALVDALRSPIMSLIAFSSFATGESRPADQEVAAQLETMSAVLVRLDVLLTDLCMALEIRNATGSGPADPGDRDRPDASSTRELIEMAIARSRPQFAEKRVALVHELPENMPTVACQPAIVANLLNNMLTEAALCSARGSHPSLEVRLVDSVAGQDPAHLAMTVAFRGLLPTETPQPGSEVRALRIIAGVLCGRAGGDWHVSEEADGRMRLTALLPIDVDGPHPSREPGR